MTIPIESVDSVSVTVGAQYPARAGFGTLNIVTSEVGVIGVAERAREYANIDDVANDWAATTEAYKAASAYFSQQPKPTKLVISVRFPTAQAAQLRGGSVPDNATSIAALASISDGTFAISIDGAAQNITGLDFSAQTTLAGVATVIQTALQAVGSGGFTAATCTYSGGRFLISSGTTGTSSTISFATPTGGGTDVSDLLNLIQGEATKSDGIGAETVTAALNAIQNANEKWYGFLFTKEVRDAVVIESENAVTAAADWAEARTKVFFNTTNNLDVLDSVTTSDIASVLKAKNLRRTITSFSSFPSQYPSASVAGRAFTVNFSQPNSTITLKFKQLPGITVENLTTGQYNVLKNKNANAFIDVGGTFIFAESFMASGVFFDEVHGIDWLKDAVQKEVFGYLASCTTKVPY